MLRGLGSQYIYAFRANVYVCRLVFIISCHKNAARKGWGEKGVQKKQKEPKNHFKLTTTGRCDRARPGSREPLSSGRGGPGRGEEREKAIASEIKEALASLSETARGRGRARAGASERGESDPLAPSTRDSPAAGGPSHQPTHGLGEGGLRPLIRLARSPLASRSSEPGRATAARLHLPVARLRRGIRPRAGAGERAAAATAPARPPPPLVASAPRQPVAGGAPWPPACG